MSSVVHADLAVSFETIGAHSFSREGKREGS